jgi:hypothetical protein
MASVAQQDKKLMALQQQIELKEAQLKQDYQRLLRDVKHNPYLQVAIDEYKTFFTKESEEKKKKIKALTDLLEHIQNKEDRLEVLKELQHIKRK